MYYEEQIIDGVLCHRYMPNAEWKLFSAKVLSSRIEALEERGDAYKALITVQKEQIALLEEHIDVVKHNPSTKSLHTLYESLEAKSKLGFTRVKNIIKSNRG
jgi:hypothetical protein